MKDTYPPAADEYTQVSYDPSVQTTIVSEIGFENEHVPDDEYYDKEPDRNVGPWRVTMSPAVEENFGHYGPKERLKQARYLREIAKQLEMSAKVALADQKPRKLNPMRQLEMSEVSSN